MPTRLATFTALLTLATLTHAAPLPLDERPAAEGEWGFRPLPTEPSPINPPRFSWRPQKSAATYTLQASRDPAFATLDYTASNLEFNVHAPDKLFPPDTWHWRFAYTDAKGNTSDFSTPRTFTLPPTAVEFPIPDRATLLSRIPTTHPRLFLRPEQLPSLRQRTRPGGDLHPHLTSLLAQCDKWVKSPPKIEEPPKYPPGTKTGSEEWREYWSGGMRKTPATLDPMVHLGLAYQLTGDTRYGDAGKRILLEVLKWDPKGATGYLYNDEAGMPYNYLFARGYTYLHPLLSDDQRAECRRVMRIRGQEMYNHLRPLHLWQPFGSHRNRAWHFLGEVAIAFHNEIPEADDWLWFAVNVFANAYPVWNDSDGGWHEGMAYWRSYLDRFSWWADAMRAALHLDAYKLPYFSQVGYYALYLQPPGTTWGGFGDQNTNLPSSGSARLMQTFAAQSNNPHWAWYAQAVATPANQPPPSARAAGVSPASPPPTSPPPHPPISSSPPTPTGYFGLLRAASYPSVEPKPPTDLPTSRLFRGTGQAFLNTNLLSAKDNVQLLFKSSPFGTQSHGYNAQNSFELYVHGLPLLLSTGQRDLYGSDHHKNWMWETKSCNNILISNRGQLKHTPAAAGQITHFSTTPQVDHVQGDASRAYDPPLKRFTRDILFLKPEKLIVIYDRLESAQPETYQYLLHAQEPFAISGNTATATNQSASAKITFLHPTNLAITQTNQFSNPPRDRIKLTQHHLTAETPAKSPRQEFVTLIQLASAPVQFTTDDGVHTLRIAGHTITLAWEHEPRVLAPR